MADLLGSASSVPQGLSPADESASTLLTPGLEAARSGRRGAPGRVTRHALNARALEQHADGRRRTPVDHAGPIVPGCGPRCPPRAPAPRQSHDDRPRRRLWTSAGTVGAVAATSVTWFVATSKPAPGASTSFATTRSTPLARSFRRAAASASPVCAAKPTSTGRSRSPRRAPSSARMSGGALERRGGARRPSRSCTTRRHRPACSRPRPPP